MMYAEGQIIMRPVLHMYTSDIHAFARSTKNGAAKKAEEVFNSDEIELNFLKDERRESCTLEGGSGSKAL
jgi:hypothetical protein